MRRPVVLLIMAWFSGQVFAAVNTDTTTFQANSRVIKSFSDEHGETTKHIPSIKKFDAGQYFYSQTLKYHDFVWSCKEYDDGGQCLDLTRSPRPPIRLVSFVHDRNDQSKIQADLVLLYNQQNDKKIELINLSEDRTARSKYQVSTLPVVVIVRGDEEIARKTGLETRQNMSNWIKHELSKP
ncbi:hypothetical protein F9L16_04270 [Agarivorans sp. B2Z047]|uniref:Thioredoxin domain-containing protein n=1 Tax=Agarivorans albus MKT 106 TaxID=1331007 RepID=R9PIC4_AGAAL|nr:MULTISPECIES: hypothetical protein [Agarivorans]MPW28213.1 hypothetical protein [Agarivorans sp. B2Z047]UQN43957.1 hypothetical protein LQZ07_05665 [Agarivorans sp. B2Z047]GAD01097.1 hypothetical protein AALB_1177 [Agarivorans albus MKT 106]